MRLSPLVLSLALLGSLAGCASASRVMISDPRPAIPVEQVQVYFQPPAVPYVEIALLDASTGGFTYGAQNRSDAVIAKLRAEAAELGANGVIVQDMAEAPSGSGVGIGVGGGGRHVGGGVGVDISPPRRMARGVAIHVGGPAR